MSQPPIEVDLSRDSMRKLMAMAKEATPILKRETYKGLRLAADPAAQAARNDVLAAPVHGPKHTGLRAGIAAGVKVGLSASVHLAGVRITSGSTGMRVASQSRMNRTFDQATFSHPIFGHGHTTQFGREWFYKPIEATRPQVEQRVREAMEVAAESLSAL